MQNTIIVMATLTSSESLVQTRSEEIFQEVVRAIKDDATPDVMLMCSHEEFVPVKKSLLCFYSPLFRVIMGSIPGTRSDMETVLMPGFRKPVVEQMIRILRMEWSDGDTWGLDLLEILQELNITIPVFFDKGEKEHPTVKNKDGDQKRTMVQAEGVVSNFMKLEGHPTFYFSKGQISGAWQGVENKKLSEKTNEKENVPVNVQNSLHEEKEKHSLENNRDQKRTMLLDEDTVNSAMNLNLNMEGKIREAFQKLDEMENAQLRQSQLQAKVSSNATPQQQRTSSQPRVYNEKNVSEPIKSPRASTSNSEKGCSIMNNKKVPEANCPVKKCSRLFTGAKVKDSLKCHIGRMHFNQEIQDLVDREYFVDSNKCKYCGKLFSNQSTKRKHLVFNHTKYVQEIMNLVNKAVERSKDMTDRPSSSPLKQTANQKIGVNVRKTSDSSQAPLKSPLKPQDLIKTVTCSFHNCGVKWKKEISKEIVRNHLISHFYERMNKIHKNYFKDTFCIKCKINSPKKWNNRHLYEKHDLFKEEVEKLFKEMFPIEEATPSSPVVKQEKFTEMPSDEKEVLENDARLNTPQPDNIVLYCLSSSSPEKSSDAVNANADGKYHESGICTENSEKTMESQDGQDSQSDEDTAYIQRMLLEDNSDSDSDTDSDSLAKRVDEDFEDEEFVDFGNPENDAPLADNEHEESAEEMDNNGDAQREADINSLLEDMSDDENDGDDELDGRELGDKGSDNGTVESMNTEDNSAIGKEGSVSMMDTDGAKDEEEDHLTQQRLLEMQDFSSSEDEDDISDDESQALGFECVINTR